MFKQYYYKGMLFFAFGTISINCQCQSLEVKNDSTARPAINDYVQKSVTANICEFNDESNIVYFEDSIKGITCKAYFVSNIDLTLIKSKCKPKDYKTISSLLQRNDLLLYLNQSPVNLLLKKDGPDAYKMLLPDHISSFVYNKDIYILISTQLVSFMSGDYWYNFLLKVDSSKSVVDQYGIGSQKSITSKGLQDILYRLYNGLKMPKQYAVEYGKSGVLK